MRILFNCLAVLLVVGAAFLVNTAYTDMYQAAFFGSPDTQPPPVAIPHVDTPQGRAALFVWHLRFGDAGGSAVAFLSVKKGDKYVTLWLTARHCVDSKEAYGFLHPAVEGAQLAPFHVVMRHPTQDVAVLESHTDFPIQTVTLATQAPQFGDKLVVAGWSLSRCLFVREGFQASAVGRFSATVIPGDSGGAVMNQKGELVGITVACALIHRPFRQLMGGVSRYEPIHEIRSWIDAWSTVKKS